MSISYKEAGVDKHEGYKAVELMKKAVEKTQNANVLNGLGSFGAMYELGKYKNPVLVSGTDGVGTKLDVAFKLKKYNTVGIDAVAMCVNDVLCHGAQPIFFLDYLACGKLQAEVAADLVSGVAQGCFEAGAALIGGETAEMPGFYKPGDYDIAGFCVGVVEKDKIVNGSATTQGDILIALPSSGVHSNGFSLVRKVIKDYSVSYEKTTIGEALLTPTRIYVKPVMELLKKYDIKGMAHITGGGLPENLPRTISSGHQAVVFKEKIKVLEIFKYIQKEGNISEDEMYGTFNMGVGFVLVVDPKDKDNILKDLITMGEEPYEIGFVQKGEKELCLK
ncbi:MULTISPECIES: phosphoribosylformylglycinamidine cyclo-ligase [Fusobacterium]|jgi:phosphoribosylformylglycinamidine cyclo-ligase|uniref:Phosphoribosylformylglycinamidine cyclo-ligase n=1 Tax=Fusobacterium hominis TaxID=2764326 RepID=A0A7G9GYS3_9FUSO|nr:MULTISPECIES: phosphoribosylformylglycinamidine cyclo-ligase [Fusobacterium]QNM15955.1 phosphoribosylformylglycinamidine cyclo-ligase [Fusobacterium hominis]